MPGPNFCDGNINSKNIFITIPFISVKAPSTITFFLFLLKMNTDNIESPLRLGQRTKTKNPHSEGEKNYSWKSRKIICWDCVYMCTIVFSATDRKPCFSPGS